MRTSLSSIAESLCTVPRGMKIFSAEPGSRTSSPISMRAPLSSTIHSSSRRWWYWRESAAC
jgi:hypothetical protein